jgi:hypothetical protein
MAGLSPLRSFLVGYHRRGHFWHWTAFEVGPENDMAACGTHTFDLLNSAQELFETGGASASKLKNKAGVTGDRVNFLYISQFLQSANWVRHAPTFSRDVDESEKGTSDLVAIELGESSTDETISTQAFDPFVYGRWRKMHLIGQIGIGPISIFGQEP